MVEMALEHMMLDYNIPSAQIDYLKTFTKDYIGLGLIKNETIPDVDAFINGLVDTSYLARPTTCSRSLEVRRSDHRQARLPATATCTSSPGSSLRAPRSAACWDSETAACSTPMASDRRTPRGMPGSGYPNGGAVMTGFAAKNVDVGYLGAPPAILNVANQNLNVKIVALANSEGSALVVKNGVESINDLNGLIIGEPGISSIQYLLLLEIARPVRIPVVKA